jgi:hypothetical protein
MKPKITIVAFLFVLGLGGCQKEEAVVKKDEITKETLDKIYRMGFGTSDVIKVEEGYLVESDIVLTPAELDAPHDQQFLRVGETEQYRTTNLVTGLPRVIRVAISSTLPKSYTAALDEAIARYNNQGLLLTFRRVTSSPHITLTKAPSGSSYLASAGFPSYGNPYNSVKVNSNYLGSNPVRSYLATILAHEIGHCIGFRHTDYMDRSYSCNGAYANEGASTVGAINIPGTPTAADPNSWMLACIGTGQNRPFNANDITALKYLY